VFEAVGLYRRAVNDALFHLDDYRYSSLVNLLIQLRRPQLTRRLHEEDLSGALSEALPPVSPGVISEVAEAFRHLESDRSTLEFFTTATNAVEQFLTGYRSYAQVAAKRRADRVRIAQDEYEAQMTEILASEADCNRSLAELARLKTEIEHLSSEKHALAAEIAVLQQSPQMKDAYALERAHREAKEKRKEADSARVELTHAVQARKARAEEHVRAIANFEQHQTRLTNATKVAAQTALAAGMDGTHREFIALFDVGPSAHESSWKQTRERIEAAIQAQMEKVDHIRQHNNRMAVLGTELQQSIVLRDQLAGLLDDARERLNAAQQEHTSATTSFLGAADDWRTNLTELRLPFEDAFLSAVTEWCESPQSFSPFDAAVRKAVEDVARNFVEQRVHLQHRQTIEMTELDQLKKERERLASSGDTPSPRPHARTERDRTGRPGAPLWLLCDFADGLDMASQAGLEAALEASRLLDAWVTPSGELQSRENDNAVLVAANTPLPPEDAHLGTMLVPCISPPDVDGQVPPYVVADILRHIGAKPNAGQTWVSTEGRWQNGPLIGCWSKPAAEHIGHTAREVARHRHIVELDAAIVETQARLDSVLVSIEQLDGRERVARNETVAAPIDDHLRAAYEQAVTVAREVDGLRSRLTKAEAHRTDKQSQLDHATKNRDCAAVDLGIAKWIDSLDSLEDGLSGYRTALSVFWPTMESFLDAGKATESAWSYLEEAKAREARQQEIAGRLESAVVTAQIGYDKLLQTRVARIDQILQQLDEARQRLDGLHKQEDEARNRHHDAELAVTRLDERLRNLTEMLSGQIDRRDSAASSLRAFAGTRLLHLAVPGISDEDAPNWSTERTVEVARQLASRLDAIESDDPIWEHLQKSVPSQFNELMQTLSAQDCQPTATFRDDVFVASALFADQECTMEDLHQILSNEVTGRQVLLNAREREILENHLVGEVPSHLHALLNAAEEQVRQINLELENRPMSTGMKLRLMWRLVEDGPSGLPEVRRRLIRSSDTWSPAERHMLGAFLQQQIHDVRSQMESGTWQEALVEALDYRKWHRFGVERYQDGVWKRLTRRTHGTGSGGEKAIALTLPHCAAAAAFYRTAHPLAPRLILLDEAFVGIDADMRAKCMGLIHTFDLDFVMTSEREWGCYQTLPGIAIYQLSTRPGIDAIGLTRWVWNGRQRTLNQNPAGTEKIAGMVAVSDE
jgi:uncharacterized protein (TIGR02680 family)